MMEKKVLSVRLVRGRWAFGWSGRDGVWRMGAGGFSTRQDARAAAWATTVTRVGGREVFEVGDESQ